VRDAGFVLGRDSAPYDEFTLVNQAVEAIKRDPRTAGQAAFVNACLRRFLRERAQLVALTDALPQAQWNHPVWWIKRLQAEQPQRWQSILRASNVQAPLTLRVNLRKTSLAAFAQALALAGMTARTVAPATVYLERAVAVARVPAMTKGGFRFRTRRHSAPPPCYWMAWPWAPNRGSWTLAPPRAARPATCGR